MVHGLWFWKLLNRRGGSRRLGKTRIDRVRRLCVVCLEAFGGFRGCAKANRKPTMALGAARGFQRLVIGLGRGSETCKEAVVGVVGSAVVEVAVCCRSYVN